MNNETMGNVPVNVAAKVLKMDNQTVAASASDKSDC